MVEEGQCMVDTAHEAPIGMNASIGWTTRFLLSGHWKTQAWIPKVSKMIMGLIDTLHQKSRFLYGCGNLAKTTQSETVEVSFSDWD